MDIIGKLPGDLLLVFGDENEDGFIEPQHMEWQRLGISNLLVQDRMRTDCMEITPCYGNRCRVMSYPDAKPRFNGSDPEINSKEVWAAQFIPVVDATQIGGAPFFVQAVTPCSLGARFVAWHRSSRTRMPRTRG